MKAPSTFIPVDWRVCKATLLCQKCNSVIWWGWGDFTELEHQAGHDIANHKCAATDFQLQQARSIMKQYRQQHNGMTFEEECRVYNEILANQTYLA